MADRPPLPPLRDDGLPTLPTGEPILQRWFVIAMIVLVPVALGVSVWAGVVAFRGDDPIPPAERRPPGDAEVTIARGDAHVPETDEEEPGPACAESITVVGDRIARAAGVRALEATCELLRSGDFAPARDGLREWVRSDGVLRVAAFELTGVESSARLEAGRLVVELNSRFQFEDATRAAPAMIHQLTLLAEPDFPGRPISAEAQLRGTQAQALACDRLRLADPAPRGCLDASELLAEDDPLGALVSAGYERDG